MKVLLSIKPEYVERIFDGEKKYEYRKTLFKMKEIESIIIYATKPIGKVVGEFKFDKILEDTPEAIWEKTKVVSGISKKDYQKYFNNKRNAYAIEISEVHEYNSPLSLSEFNPKIKVAPQSFMYV